MRTRALLSVHDLRPETLPQVLRVLSLVEDAGVPPCTLLVEPGTGWEEPGLATLKDLVTRGYRLAGHGWRHRAPRPRTLHHRVHAALISRDQAEHLSRSREELLELVQRSYRWFHGVGLPSPDLYVPPAWALGRLTRRDLVELPFHGYEVLTGLVDGRNGTLHPLPLVGFEADTSFRRRVLKVFNGLNLLLARTTGRPVRISIHPHDLELLLGEELRALVRSPLEFVLEEDVLGPH